MNASDIIELNDSNWEKIVEKGKKAVFVMFYSNNCPYCIQMKPVFLKYAEEFKDKVLFTLLNVSSSPTISSRYGVMGTPTFKFFCKGKPIQELTGAVYPTLLKKTVEDFLDHGKKCVENTTWFDPSYA